MSMEQLVDGINENLTSVWTGLSNAISQSSEFISDGKFTSATDAERFGAKMMDIAADYSRGIMTIADGFGTPAEKQMLQEMGRQILEGIENMRQSGADAYARYGEQVAEAASEARRAGLAEAGGAAVDLNENNRGQTTVYGNF